MSNEEIRSAALTFAQVKRNEGPRVNTNESTMASRLRDFSRMTPPPASV